MACWVYFPILASELLLASTLLYLKTRRSQVPGVLPFLLWMIIACLAQIILCGLALGYSARLNASNLLLSQSVLTVLTLLYARANLPSIWPFLRGQWAQVRSGYADLSRVEVWLGGILLFFLLVMGVTSALSTPSIIDTMTYRLPAIGHFLQEQSVWHFPTNEARMNYNALNPLLVMAILTMPFERGFPLVCLAQYTGFLTAVLAILGFGSFLRFSSLARLASVYFLMGMPNTFAQSMTAHTDLFTAGTLIAGLYFLTASLKTGKGTTAAWLGISIAVGSKATVFFFGFGLALYTLVLVFHFRPDRASLLAHVRVGLIALCLFGFPRYLENFGHYGNPFSTREEIARHHEYGALGSKGGSFVLDAATYAIQTLDPHANSRLLHPFFDRIGRFLINLLPKEEAFAFDQYSRFETLNQIWNSPTKESDTASTGLIVPMLALLGGVYAMRRYYVRRETASLLILTSILAIGVFFASYLIYFPWNAFAFRYFILVSPFLALAAAYLVSSIRSRWWDRFWLAAIILQASVFADCYFTIVDSGFRNTGRNRHLFGKVIEARKKQFASAFIENGESVGIAAPDHSILSSFFRNGTNARIRLIPSGQGSNYDTLAEFLRSTDFDVLLVHPGAVIDRIGGAKARLLIASESITARESLLAVKLIKDGETPDGFITGVGFSVRGASREVIQSVSFRAHGKRTVNAFLSNRSHKSRLLSVRSSVEARTLEIAAGGSLTAVIEVARDDTIELSIPFDGSVPPESLEELGLDYRLLDLAEPF